MYMQVGCVCEGKGRAAHARMYACMHGRVDTTGMHEYVSKQSSLSLSFCVFRCAFRFSFGLLCFSCSSSLCVFSFHISVLALGGGLRAMPKHALSCLLPLLPSSLPPSSKGVCFLFFSLPLSPPSSKGVCFLVVVYFARSHDSSLFFLSHRLPSSLFVRVSV